MSSLHVIAGIAWDPQIRGFLAVAVGVVVLLGSGLLLLGTNVGARLSFLVTATAFWGWMALMGAVWWAYGTVGMLGTLPSWEVREIVYPGTEQAGLPEARALDTSGLPDPDVLADATEDEVDVLHDEYEQSLRGWRILPEANPSFGEAKATVDEYFLAEGEANLGIDGPDDYVTVYSFEQGGKDRLPSDPSRIDRITKWLRTTFWQVRHPPHYALVQVQPVIEQEAAPGAPPPIPQADDSAPVVSVIMERELGDRRFPGAMTTIGSTILFGLFAHALHRRDRQVAEVRGMLPAPSEA